MASELEALRNTLFRLWAKADAEASASGPGVNAAYAHGRAEAFQEARDEADSALAASKEGQ